MLYERGGTLMAAINTGAGLLDPKPWGHLGEGEISKTESVGVGGGADFTVTVGPLCWPTVLCYSDINPGFHVDGGFSATRSMVTDVDGDGLIDRCRAVPRTG